MLVEGLTQARGRQPQGDEDGGERGDEEQARHQDPPPVGLGELVGSDPADDREVARYERQHARRDERDDAGAERGEEPNVPDAGAAGDREHGVYARAVARRRRCARASGCSAPSSVKIATITFRRASRRSVSGSLVIAPCRASRAGSDSPASQSSNALASEGGRIGGLEAGSRGEAVRDEVALEPVEEGEGLVEIAAGDEDLPELGRGLGVPGVGVERRAQRRLVAGRGQPLGLGGDETVQEGVDLRRRDRTGELGGHLAVAKGLHGRDPADAERGGERLVAVDVDLGELDGAFALGDRALQGGRERPARAAPGRPEVDDDGKLRASARRREPRSRAPPRHRRRWPWREISGAARSRRGRRRCETFVSWTNRFAASC